MVRSVSSGRHPRVLARALARWSGRRLRRVGASERVSHVEAMGLRREPIVDIGAVLAPRVLLFAAVAIAAAAWLS